MSKTITDIFPNLKILDKKSTRSGYVLVEDENGVVYECYRLNVEKGYHPGISSAVNKNLCFSFKSKEKFSNKFTYENVKYLGGSKTVDITCLNHGTFRITPTNHLSSRLGGCKGCRWEKSRSMYGTIHEDFLKEMEVLHPKLKVRSEYVRNNIHVIVEDELGIKYKIQPAHLRAGKTPSIQSAVDQRLAFEILSRVTHGDKYDYSLVKYTNSHAKVEIICPKHGMFLKQASKHLYSGEGCIVCAKTHMGNGYYKNLENWGKSSNVYLFRLSGLGEVFYKIGIARDVYRRIEELYKSSSTQYVIEILAIRETTVEKAFYELEQPFIKAIKSEGLQYIPKVRFEGFSECFEYCEESISEIINLIEG